MNLTHDAMLVSLRISAWSGRLYDRKASNHVAVHHDASTSAERYNKCLLPKAAFAALTATMSKARSSHYEQTLPWDDQGSRLLTVANYEHYMELLDGLRERMVRERARFIEDYEDNIDQARLDLGKIFRIEDYPSKDALQDKVLRDLFSNDDDSAVWFDDPALLNNLAMENLRVFKDELETRWKWATAMVEVDWNTTARYGRIYPEPAERTPEEQAEIEKLEARQGVLAELDDDAWTEDLIREAETIEECLDEIEGGIEARAVYRREDFGIHPSRTRRRSARSGGRPSSGRRRPGPGSYPVLHASASSHGRPPMKLDPTPIPAAAPVAATPVAATPAGPTDEVHKRAIADAVWTDLLWLMPPDRTVTITVDGGNVAVELGPPRPARCAISH